MDIKKQMIVLGALGLSLLSLCWMVLPVSASEKGNPEKPWAVFDYLGKPIKGGEYRTATAQSLALLNPHHWPITNWDVIDMVYDIYFTSGEDTKMEPWMVDSWEFTDPLTCNMTFMKGIRFHDGTPFNAEWSSTISNGLWTRKTEPGIGPTLKT